MCSRRSSRHNLPGRPRVPASRPIPEIDFAKFGPVEVTERSKLDKLTAANMQRSWLNVPHVTQFDEADITALEEFRTGLKAEAEQRGTRLTPMPFILKACAVALRDNPKFNSSLAADGRAAGVQALHPYRHGSGYSGGAGGAGNPGRRQENHLGTGEEVLALADKARDRKLSARGYAGWLFYRIQPGQYRRQRLYANRQCAGGRHSRRIHGRPSNRSGMAGRLHRAICCRWPCPMTTG